MLIEYSYLYYKNKSMIESKPVKKYKNYLLFKRYIPYLQKQRRASYQIWAESENAPSFTVACSSPLYIFEAKELRSQLEEKALRGAERRIDESDIKEDEFYEVEL